MTKQIRINQGELAELLQGEIKKAEVYMDAATGAMQIVLEWYGTWFDETATLYHMISDQTYYIVSSTSPDMTRGETINVDEILDIVL